MSSTEEEHLIPMADLASDEDPLLRPDDQLDPLFRRSSEQLDPLLHPSPEEPLMEKLQIRARTPSITLTDVEDVTEGLLSASRDESEEESDADRLLKILRKDQQRSTNNGVSQVNNQSELVI